MMKTSSLVLLFLASSAIAPASGTEIEISVKKEFDVPGFRKTVLTEKAIKDHLKKINKLQGQKNCLECSVEFYKWAAGVNKKPEQAKNRVPSTPNFEYYGSETSSESSESSDDSPIMLLDGFLRKRHDIDQILMSNPVVVDVEAGQEYIDLATEFNARFVQITKDSLETYLDSLTLKKHGSLQGEFSIGIINAFYVDVPTYPTDINCHFFNFYIYQLPNKQKKILIVDPLTGEHWEFQRYLTLIIDPPYDDNRFFVWSCTQPSLVPVKIEDNTDATSSLPLSRTKRARENDDIMDGNKSQKRAADSNPTSVGRTHSYQEVFFPVQNLVDIGQSNSSQQILMGLDQHQQNQNYGAQQCPAGNTLQQSAVHGSNSSILTNGPLSTEALPTLKSQNNDQHLQGQIQQRQINKPVLTNLQSRDQLQLAQNNLLGQGTPGNKPNYLAARAGFKAVRDNPLVSAGDKAIAQLNLAIMDYLGQGTPDNKPNYLAAREGFEAVWKNPHASGEDKAKAQLESAIMDFLGQGTPDNKPNYLAAREGFEAVRDNPHAREERKASAQLGLAIMDRLGQGTPDNKPDYLAAREGFEAVRDNPHARGEDKAQAQLNLAIMDCLGQGTPDNKPNYLEAREGYEAVRDNPVVSERRKARAQLGLAIMDRLGQGTLGNKPNYLVAREGFEAVRDNPHVREERKAAAQLYLAEMDHWGEGTPDNKPNYSEAREGFEAVLTNPDAEADDKAKAQKMLTDMDYRGEGVEKTPNSQIDFRKPSAPYPTYSTHPSTGGQGHSELKNGQYAQNNNNSVNDGLVHSSSKLKNQQPNTFLGQQSLSKPYTVQNVSGGFAMQSTPTQPQGAMQNNGQFLYNGQNYVGQMSNIGPHKGISVSLPNTSSLPSNPANQGSSMITLSQEDLSQLIQSAIQTNNQAWWFHVINPLNARIQALEQKQKDNA